MWVLDSRFGGALCWMLADPLRETLSMRFARAFPSILLLALFLLFAVAPGCGAGSEPPAAELLRQSFPEQAADVLDRREVFVAVDEGFARRAADGPAVAPGADTALRAALPQSAQSPIRLRSPGSNFEVRVRELEVSGEGVLAGGAVAYPRAGGTSFWAATEAGVEEWLLLDAGLARAGHVVASWAIEGGVVHQQGEMIIIDDEAGVPRLRVTAPSAFAAGGRPVSAKLAARGATIELTVDGGGEAVLVDPSWTATSSMIGPRTLSTATLLQSGKVLVAGGVASNGDPTAEVYDPVANTWTATANTMAVGRYNAAAVLLDSGKVLVTGGANGSRLNSTSLYDPATNSFTAGPLMTTTHFRHTATKLGNGKVLVTGGWQGPSIAVAELYDPATNTFKATGSMTVGREFHAAVLLGTGKVLVVAGGDENQGIYFNSAELYDPATATWTVTGAMTTARALHAIALLPSGKVLAVGGHNGAALASAEVYDPAAGTWSSGGAMAVARSEAVAALYTPLGRVLVVGGSTSAVDLYDPATNTWTATTPLSVSWTQGTLTMLNNNLALAVGGSGGTFAALYSVVNGTTCTKNIECSSGFCVDNFCCNTACSGLCQACSAAKTGGTNGTCGSVIAATDPDNDCAAQATSTCGTNGSCDGAGKCQLYVNGTACVAASCSGSTLNNASACNGAGTCVAGGTQSCGAYLCVGAACPTTCAATSDCTAGNFCVAGKCVPPQMNGAVCTAANQCASGNCVDGFCCNTACNGLCQACSAAKSGGSNGTCSGVGVATDPDNECTAQATATCGTNGSCNGAGACQLFASGTTCAAASCSGSTLNKGSACNGTGTCASNGTQDCAPYVCTGAACKTNCTSNADCTMGNLCLNNKCGSPLPDGSVCSTAGQCNSGNCVDGVCCTTACSAGACDACSVAAGGVKDGTCALLTGNTCDDGMACTQADTCAAGVCAGAVMCAAVDACHTAGACDAAGACTTPIAIDGSACDDSNGCTQADTCAAGKCSGGIPVVCAALDTCHDVGTCDQKLGACSNPAKENGASCDDGDICTTDSCMGGVCTAGAAMPCPEPDACHTGGTCMKGVCPNEIKNVPCPLASDCETIVLACDVNTGACVKSTKPDGSPCGVGGSCLGGTCDGSASTSSGSASTGSAGTGSAGTGSAGTGSAGTGSAGTGSAGTGAGGGTASGPSSGAGTGGNAGDGTVSPAGGCGCSTVGASESRAPWLLFGLVLVLGRRRRQPRA